MSEFKNRKSERVSKKSARTLGLRCGSTPLGADTPTASVRSERLAYARGINIHAEHPPTPLNSDASGRVGDTI